MQNLFTVVDKSGRLIRLTNERWDHLSKHPDVLQNIELIKETLQNPLKITGYSLDKTVHYYYRFYKDRKSPAKYLRIIVKYLNGDGFIITAHYVMSIR